MDNKAKNVVVSNIHCEHVKVTSTTIPNKFIASYTFHTGAALHGLLIAAVGKAYEYNPSDMNKDILNTTCDPSIVDGNHVVIVSETKRRDSVIGPLECDNTMPTMRRVNLSAALHKQSVFSARVDLEFEGVEMVKHDDDSQHVTTTYKSLRVVGQGTMFYKEAK